MINEEFWKGVPPLDIHEYIDRIEIDSAISTDAKARDAEAQVLVVLNPVYEGKSEVMSRVDVRRKLLGQWTNDGSTPFSADEIKQLRRHVVPILRGLSEEDRQAMKGLFA